VSDHCRSPIADQKKKFGFFFCSASDLAETIQDIVKLAIYAIIVLIIGYIVIAIINWVLKKAFAKTKMDALVQNFARRVIVFVLKLLLWTFIIGIINLDILSVSALIAALGVAIGFTLSGMLGNFIAGCVLLTKKPFKVGDFVNCAGVEGKITTIEIFSTLITTGDNKVIFVPNGSIVSGVITNVTAEPERRIDLTVSVAYSTDVPKATKVLNTILSRNKAVLKTAERAPVVRVAELADSSVNFVVRPWVLTGDYFPTKCTLVEEIKKRFHEAGIVMPRPQTDVHLFEGKPTVAKEIEWSDDDEDDDASDEDDAATTVAPVKKGIVGKATAAVTGAMSGAASKVKGVFTSNKAKKAAAEEEAKKKKEIELAEATEDEEEEETEEDEDEEEEESEDEEEEESPTPEPQKTKKKSSSKSKSK
jgi:small conductance mechanosensitive channel